jgi:hypothetical protein
MQRSARWLSTPRRWASAGGVWLALSSGSVAGAPSVPAEPELSARLVCPRRPTPGRVVCEAELEVDSGLLSWADVLVLEAPAFAPPLRARVGPSALFMKTEQRQRLQLALAATSAGTGTLRVRARAVHCHDAQRAECHPTTREASARVEVGPITP